MWKHQNKMLDCKKIVTVTKHYNLDFHINVSIFFRNSTLKNHKHTIWKHFCYIRSKLYSYSIWGIILKSHSGIWEKINRNSSLCIQLFSSVQLLSHDWLFATPWTAARQASLFITNYQSPPRPMTIESGIPSNHLILCRPLLLLHSIFPSIRVFSNASALRIRWPKYWSFSFNISPTNEHPGLISFGCTG